jgi:hypothetical protein
VTDGGPNPTLKLTKLLRPMKVIVNDLYHLKSRYC